MNDSSPPFARSGKDEILLDIHLAPRAKRSSVMGIHQNRLKIAVTAPPVDGKANDALVELVAKLLSVPKGRISVVRGLTSRQKVVSVGIGDAREGERILAALDGILRSG